MRDCKMRDEEMFSSEIRMEDFRRLGKAVEEPYVGRRVDYYLGKVFLFRSRTTWQRVIDERKVLVNGEAVKASYMLKEGDEVYYYRPQSSEPPVDRNIYCLWEKSGVMAVYKPSNLPMHEGGAYRRNTFCEALKERFGPSWAPMHRLDRETSGIVLCSDQSGFRNLVSEDFYRKRVSKTYFAFVMGSVEQDEWDVDQPIGEARQTTFRQKFWVEEGGLASQTHFKIRERAGSFTFLEVSPRTGRTHQIRVHSAWSGYPLVGDKKYCPDESVYLEYYDHGFSKRIQEAVLFDRLCLHAAKIAFTHPGDKKTYEISCELPGDMRSIWTSLSLEKRPSISP